MAEGVRDDYTGIRRARVSKPREGVHGMAIRILTIILLLVCVSSAFASEPAGIEVPPFAVRFERPKGHEYNAVFLADGAPVYTLTGLMGEPQVSVKQGFPAPGTTTTLYRASTGGAHCCAYLFLFTKTPAATHFQLAELTHSTHQLKTIAGRQVIGFRDSYFAYYAPAGEGGPSMSYAASPAPERFLVLDKAGWRIDRKGEFAAHYRGLAQATLKRFRRTGDDAQVSGALYLAYYGLMAGGTAQEALATLKRTMPRDWRGYERHFLADLLVQTEAFTPVIDMATESHRADELTYRPEVALARFRRPVCDKYGKLLKRASACEVPEGPGKGE